MLQVIPHVVGLVNLCASSPTHRSIRHHVTVLYFFDRAVRVVKDESMSDAQYPSQCISPADAPAHGVQDALCVREEVRIFPHYLRERIGLRTRVRGKRAFTAVIAPKQTLRTTTGSGCSGTPLPGREGLGSTTSKSRRQNPCKTQETSHQGYNGPYDWRHVPTNH